MGDFPEHLLHRQPAALKEQIVEKLLEMKKRWLHS